jgi:hypothetical protein
LKDRTDVDGVALPEKGHDAVFGSVRKEKQMAQINFHTTPKFDADLAVMMSALRIKSKSEAIRLTVHDVATVIRERAARDKEQAANLPSP